MEILKLCKQIGIETFGDLERFKKEYKLDCESLEYSLRKYLFELGW